MRISACASLIYIIVIIFQLMKMMYDSYRDTFSIMEGKNSESDSGFGTILFLIGQPYLTEPMGCSCMLALCFHCGSAVCSEKTADFMKKGGEWR